MRACSLGRLCWPAVSGRRDQVKGGLGDHGVVVQPKLGRVELLLSGQLACTDPGSETGAREQLPCQK